MEVYGLSFAHRSVALAWLRPKTFLASSLLAILETDLEAMVAVTAVVVAAELQQNRFEPGLIRNHPAGPEPSQMPDRWGQSLGYQWDRPPGTSPQSTPTHFHAYQKAPRVGGIVAYIAGLAKTTR